MIRKSINFICLVCCCLVTILVAVFSFKSAVEFMEATVKAARDHGMDTSDSDSLSKEQTE